MSTPLTADQATALLRTNPGAYTTPDQLKALAAQVDANPAGRLTVAYSGGVGRGVWSTDVVEAMMANGEDIRVINKSQAASFLQSEDFYSAVGKTYGVPPRSLRDGTVPRGHPSTEWLYHPTQGPWAEASARFANATVGEVITIANRADPTRTFGAVELERFIANPRVTKIEGIPRETLAKVQATQGLQPAFEMVVAHSHDNLSALRVQVNATGMPFKEDNGPMRLDSRTRFIDTPIQGKAPASTDVTRSLADLAGPPNATARIGRVRLEDLNAQAAHPNAVTVKNSARGAGALGIAALAYDGLTTARDTAHLLDQGNVTGAQSQVLHFAGRTSGGVVGAAAMGLAAGSAFGPVAAVGASVVGGAIGALRGDKFADAFDQQRIHTQRGSDGNAWHLDERPGHGWMRMSADAGPGRGGMPMRPVYADARLADELNYKASSVAVELALAHPRAPYDPYSHTPESIGEKARPGIGANEPWTRDSQSHAWTRQALEPASPMTHGMPVQRAVMASPEQSRQLDAAAQRIIADNIAHGPQGIAQRYQEAYGQHGWKQHGPVPAAVTNAAQGQVPEGRDATRQQMPAPPQPASGHLTPQQIERITTHESRVVPTPGGMRFAEAHQRRDEPEQISPGLLQPVGKLDTSSLTKGSLLYRMHQANEHDLMRSLGVAQAQDRERFNSEPSPSAHRTLQPSVERTQERALDPEAQIVRSAHAAGTDSRQHNSTPAPQTAPAARLPELPEWSPHQPLVEE